MRRSLVFAFLGMFAASALAGGAAAQQPGTQYVRYEQGGAISWGVLDGQTIRQLSDAPYLGGTETGRTVQRSAVTLKAPVDPSLVVMTALNFRSHLGRSEPAEYPGLFIVPANSIVGPEEGIVVPAGSTNFHYEAEAVVVVGKRAENVSLEDAPQYIFGVTAGNDGSERSWQSADLQWTRAKGTRGFNSVGPVLVTGLDYNNLDITGRLNGEERQHENTSDMLFDFNYMLSYISHHFTLEPGDLIWSGTMNVTRAMKPGDVYEVEIPGVGILRNPIVQGK